MIAASFFWRSRTFPRRTKGRYSLRALISLPIFTCFELLFHHRKLTNYIRPYVISYPAGCRLYPAVLCHAQPDITWVTQHQQVAINIRPYIYVISGRIWAMSGRISSYPAGCMRVIHISNAEWILHHCRFPWERLQWGTPRGCLSVMQNNGLAFIFLRYYIINMLYPIFLFMH